MSHYAQNGEGMEVDTTKAGLGRSPSVNQKIHYVGGENAPEVVPQMEQQHGMYQEGVYENASAPSYGQEQVEKSGKGGTICGMRKKLFWILLGVLALVVIVVVVVVAVVVTKNNSNSNDGSTSSGSSLGSG